MREVSDRGRSIIDGGQFQVSMKLTAFYGAEVTLANVPVASWSFNAELGRDIPTFGEVDAVYSDEGGVSVSPRAFTDALAPFGQEVVPELTLSVGPFKETFVLGRFRIDETPEAWDSNHRFRSRVITTASRVKLKLVDGLEKVRASGFVLPTRPGSSSCWAELARLTGMQIVRSLPDRSMPSVEYELSQAGRLKVCRAIAERLGGTLYVRSDGALTVISDTPGPVVKTIPLGADGLRLSEISRQLSKEQLYNEVVGVFQDANRDPIYVAPARVTDGPLSVHGPLGHRTRYYASDFVNTVQQAQAAVRKILEQSSTLATVTVPVSITLDPTLEIGDTVAIEQDTETLTGTVVKSKISSDMKMTIDVAVTATRTEANLGRPRAFS